MPTDAELASFYPATYHAQTGAGLLNKVRQGMRFRRLEALMADDGAILDFGCGNGAFLFYAAARLPGRRFFGYEIADERRVTEHLDGAVTIVNGSIDDLLGVLPPCRLITLNHVIEHLPDPYGAVAALADHLLPGAAFEGQTPAAGSLEHRVFRTCWSGYHAPRHTVVFSMAGLRIFLSRVGLEHVDVDGGFNPAALAVSLAAVARQRSRRPIHREGLGWLAYIGLAGLLGPIDRFSGSPGIQNFLASYPEGRS
jgi:SAM-dependent methyltransferase